ncbi:MAG: hypothetical protein AB7Y46_00665 [Armatimonadota bacterium]
MKHVPIMAVLSLIFAAAAAVPPDDGAEAVLTPEQAREARQQAIRGTLATYDGEPRLENGHVDIDRLVRELQELNCNTYDFLIWHAQTDWEDLHTFLEATESTGLKVWVSLVPPSESRTNKSEPFGLDYVQWAHAIGELSAQYPRIIAWSIDDFTHNLSFYTPEYLQEMMDAAHAHNPRLAFVPCTYFPAATQDFANRYSGIIDGLLFYYRHESAGANLTDPSLCPDEIATLRERFGEDFPIILGFYATGHSRLGQTTPEYVEAVMNYGHELADGVHVYTHQAPGTPKGDVVKRLFGEWSAAQE